MTVALKPYYKTTEEINKIKQKFDHLRTTVSTYKTQYGSPCVLYIYWQGSEKAGQLQDYGYAKCFKSFIDKEFYTDNKEWVNK